MPIYEYECEQCGIRFDRRQRFSEEPLTECPQCSGSVHRVIQPVGVIFKGSGFYVTDNRGKSSTMPLSGRDRQSEESSPSTANGSSEAGEGKTDEK